jgi:hypothetical protein
MPSLTLRSIAARSRRVRPVQLVSDRSENIVPGIIAEGQEVIDEVND